MRTHGVFHANVRRIAALALCDLVALFGRWIDFSELPDRREARRRIFPLERTFWLFLAQILSPGMSCAEAVKKVIAETSARGGKTPSPNTAAYCKARKRLPDRILGAIQEQVKAALVQRTRPSWRWHGHPVKIVDATQISMEDTPANRRAYRYPKPDLTRPGCGFPALKMLAFFSLATGGLLHYLEAPNRRSEQSLFRALWKRALEAGDVVLGDRFFCNFASFAKLQARSIHLVVRQNATLSASLRPIRRLGKRDHLCQWHRCRVRAVGFSRAAWNHLPKTLWVRQIEVVVEEPGMRTSKILILTTLLDPRKYPSREFAELYRRRWAIELHFRTIKKTMGMGFLPCRTPAMVRKQLALSVLAYNLVRLLMAEASAAHGVPLDRLSFKAAFDAARHWSPLMARQTRKSKRLRLYKDLLACIAAIPIPKRPGRREPRAVKHRPKAYEFLSKPRHLFREKTKRQSSPKYRRFPKWQFA